MEVGGLLVDEEGVRHPDLVDVLRAHHQLVQRGRLLEGEARVRPKLTEVHVQGEVLVVVTLNGGGRGEGGGGEEKSVVSARGKGGESLLLLFFFFLLFF